MAKTVYIATNLTTIIDAGGNSRDVPDLGVQVLTEVLTGTGSGIYIGAYYGRDPFYGAISLADINGIQIGPDTFRLYSGQVQDPAMFDAILAALGSARVKTGKEALASPFRGRIESVVKSIRRKSNGQTLGFQAHTAISGDDPVLSTLDPEDDPSDVEAVSPL